MAERRPPGFNVDLGFYDSDEVLSIPRKIRAAAVGVWTLCGSYSANKLTDGYVSTEALKDRGCTPAIRSALMSTTPQPLWESAPETGDVGAIRFTRWAKWQRTSGEVKAYREADAERKRKAREARRAAETSDDSEMSERTPDGHPPDVRSDSGTPKTETETKTEFFGYVQSSPYESDATRERDDLSPPVTVGASRLVQRAIPANAVNDSTRAGLRIEASQLLASGEAEPDVEACLRLWLTKPDLGVKALKALMAEVYKSRNPTNGKPVSKLRGYAELAQQVRAEELTQLEIAATPRKLT